LKWAEEEHDIVLVPGFSRIGRAVGAAECTGRVASFAESSDFRCWYVHQSGPGFLSWWTEAVPTDVSADRVAFVFAMGLGNGHPLPQPSGQFDLYLNDEKVISFRVVKHSQTWRHNDAAFHFSANRIEAAQPNTSIYLDNHLTNEAFAAFGLGLLCVPAATVPAGGSCRIEIIPNNRCPSTRWFQLASVPRIIETTDIYRAVASLGTRQAPESGGYKVFFGDIHTHSAVTAGGGEGCGMGTIDENYQYAMGPGGLDLYALTDHERQLSAETYCDYFRKADEYTQEGSFVALPGYEFTNSMWGHRNVYFESCDCPLVGAPRSYPAGYWDLNNLRTPEELWVALDNAGVRAITVPHHPSATSHPLTWDHFNPKYDRLVEVYSSWGSSEYYGDYPRGVSDRFRGLYVRDALNQNLRLGLIASSDGHDGHPGNAQSPLHKHHHIFHPLGSGWIAVLAPELGRKAVFDAMYERRCYATTGVPIVLDVSMEGHPMGLELSLAKRRPLRLQIKVMGANGLDHIRIIKNGKIRETIPCHGEWEADIDWIDGQPAMSNYYYVRVVQTDRESAWSSPIWVDFS